MRSINKNIFSFLLIYSFVFQSGANIKTGLNNFFDDLNMNKNVTSGGYYEGQAAGYLTGGGLYARTTSTNIQLLSIQLPSANAGCGGIDVYLGAFSFINSESITRFIKSVMSNSVGYAFDLALETLAPSLKSIKDHLQTLVNEVNDSNFSSCQAAKLLVGGVASAVQGNNEAICKAKGNSSGAFSDFLEARIKCGDDSTITKQNNQAKDDKEFKDLVLTSTNTTWDEIKSAPDLFFEDKSKEYRSLIMTLVGTIIFDSEGKMKIINPQINNRNLVTMLMDGSATAEIFMCDEAELCLKPSLKQFASDESKSFKQSTKKILLEIIQKVKTDEPLSAKQKAFIEYTKVPVFKYIIDSASIDLSESYVNQFSEIIARDILINYLTDILSRYNLARGNKPYPLEVTNAFQNMHQSAQMQLSLLKNDLYQLLEKTESLEQKMKDLRKEVSALMLNRFINNLNY